MKKINTNIRNVLSPVLMSEERLSLTDTDEYISSLQMQRQAFSLTQQNMCRAGSMSHTHTHTDSVDVCVK